MGDAFDDRALAYPSERGSYRCCDLGHQMASQSKDLHGINTLGALDSERKLFQGEFVKH